MNLMPYDKSIYKRARLGKRAAVFGIFKARAGLENAVDELKKSGFQNSDISALLPTQMGSRYFAHRKSTKAPEGFMAGATTGIILGGSLGYLVGIGALPISGLGAFVAAGPIMAALAGAGLGGTAGGLAGALVGMGVPEYEAKRFEGYVKEGGMLLSVHTGSAELQKRAMQIFRDAGGMDIGSEAERVSA